MAASTADAAATKPTLPIEEVSHPSYVDAVGVPVAWADVRELSRGTEARAQVRKRRYGRTALRFGFAGVTALEVWGGVKLAQDDSWVAIPVIAQAVFTGTCAILSWTRLPGDRREDRAILLDGVNAPYVR